MRALNREEQDQRKKKVLQFVIHEFVRTGKPVGSKAVSATSHLGLSPATIRHVLSELEKEEIVAHPHTSAGRVPTDKGYRLYVDSLIELQRLAVQEEKRIRNEYERRIREIEGLLSQTSRILSSISHYTGFVMTPKFERNIFSRLELIPINEHRILVAMITESGLAKNFIINSQVELPRERLYTIARMIDRNLQGCTLQEVQLRMTELLESAEQDHREVASLAREIGEEIKKFSTSEIYMDGASNILSLPDFSKTEELHNLFRIIEEKQLLTSILEEELLQQRDFQVEQETVESDTKQLLSGRRAKKQDGKRSDTEWGRKSRRKESELISRGLKSSRVHVSIGSEHPLSAMQNLSLVSSTYQLSDKTVGVLGILGPKRMEYSKMISLVDYVSRMVDQFIRKFDAE